jgi:hypothetical protein
VVSGRRGAQPSPDVGDDPPFELVDVVRAEVAVDPHGRAGRHRVGVQEVRGGVGGGPGQSGGGLLLRDGGQRVDQQGGPVRRVGRHPAAGQFEPDVPVQPGTGGVRAPRLDNDVDVELVGQGAEPAEHPGVVGRLRKTGLAEQHPPRRAAGGDGGGFELMPAFGGQVGPPVAGQHHPGGGQRITRPTGRA